MGRYPSMAQGSHALANFMARAATDPMVLALRSAGRFVAGLEPTEIELAREARKGRRCLWPLPLVEQLLEDQGARLPAARGALAAVSPTGHLSNASTKELESSHPALSLYC
jgi:hypothetical protein